MNLKLKLLDQLASTNDHRKTGAEAVNLLYLLAALLAGQTNTDREFHLLIADMSSKNQKIYLDRITQLFDYFQLLGFSPDEIKDSLLKDKSPGPEVEKLKILAKEIVAKLSKED